MEQNRKRPDERGTSTVNRERRTATASPSGGSRPRTGNPTGEAERRSRTPRQNAARPSGAQETSRRMHATVPTDARASASERRARQAQAETRREREAHERAKQEREARELTKREREAREQTRREREARAAERRAREAAAKKQREREEREQVKRAREAREQEKKTQREREKQKRSEQKARAKKRQQKKPHRVYNMNIGFKIATMLAVVAVIVVSMIIFFKVKHIQVVLQGVDAAAPIATTAPNATAGDHLAETTAPEETQAEVEAARQGHGYYTAEEIIEASGIHVDDNLLSLSKATVASRIRIALPYVNQIQIKKQLPGTVIIIVSEFEVTYGIQDETGGWWLMSREGRILEPATEQTVRGHLLITGMPIQVPKPGDWFKPAATEGADMAEIAAKQKVVLEVIPVLEKAPFFKELSSVDVSTSYNLTLWYGTRYEIWLGTVEKLDYKFRFLEAALLDKEIQHRSGTIDLTFSEDNKAHFMDFR